MLTRMYVNNFRSLAPFEWRPVGNQLVVGRNGSGKSTVFEVLRALRDSCIRGVPFDARRASGEQPFSDRTRTQWLDLNERVFELDVQGEDGLYSFRLELDSWGAPSRPRVVREEVACDGRPVFRFAKGEVHLYNDRFEDRVQYPFDWRLSALATIDERRDNRKLTWFKRWLGGVLCIRPDPFRMQGVAADEVRDPEEDLSNFAEWYRHLRQEYDDDQFVSDLRDALPGLVGLKLEDAGERRRELKLRFADGSKTNGSKTSYFLSEISDGQRVLLGLYAVLHFALKPGRTLCFDEPDNFIALHEIRPWLERTLEVTEGPAGKAQVFIASHHPELLNRMAFKEGVLFERPNGRETRVRKFEDRAGTGLSASELLSRGWENE